MGRRPFVLTGWVREESALGEDAFDLHRRFFRAIDEPDPRPHLSGEHWRQQRIVGASEHQRIHPRVAWAVAVLHATTMHFTPLSTSHSPICSA